MNNEQTAPLVPIKAPETDDEREQRELTRHWQQQFHQLEALCIQAGYKVAYGDRGQVTLSKDAS